MKKYILNKVKNNEFLRELKAQPDYNELQFKDGLYFVDSEKEFENVKKWLNAKTIINNFLEELRDFSYDGSISDYNIQQGLAAQRTNDFIEIIAKNFKFLDTIELSKDIENGKYNYLCK